jgi:hypothetical protein
MLKAVPAVCELIALKTKLPTELGLTLNRPLCPAILLVTESVAVIISFVIAFVIVTSPVQTPAVNAPVLVGVSDPERSVNKAEPV